jgi:hypothetical protein
LVTFSPDGRWLVVASDWGLRFCTVGSWELDSTRSKRKHRGPAFAADAALMAAGAEDGRHVELIASETGRELATLTLQDFQTGIGTQARRWCGLAAGGHGTK